MGENTLEGKALPQIRPELQWDIAGKQKHALPLACLSCVAAVGTASPI